MSETQTEWVIEIIGWVGSAAILLAYALNSYQRIRSDQPTFQWLNLIGGTLLMGYTFYKDALANTFLNLVWVVVAIVALARLFRKRTAKQDR
jgi:hypothetical protein